MMKPLFVPLKTEHFEAFAGGYKDTEYRLYGTRWNERTCRPGRRVVLSKGYGKQQRLYGVIASFEQVKFINLHPNHQAKLIELYAATVMVSSHIAAIKIQVEQPPVWKGPQAPAESRMFQSRVQPWLTECFGPMIAGDHEERNHRFLEEAMELVQACGCTADEAHKLVDYVFSRPVGEKRQEVGGVMVTLAALCLAHDLDMHKAAEMELVRITQPEVIIKIREKQKRKPAMSSFPSVYPERTTAMDEAAFLPLMRDITEQEPDDPDHECTVCINYDWLYERVRQAFHSVTPVAAAVPDGRILVDKEELAMLCNGAVSNIDGMALMKYGLQMLAKYFPGDTE